MTWAEWGGLRYAVIRRVIFPVAASLAAFCRRRAGPLSLSDGRGMRVLVTGGAGYGGSHAVRLLSQAGHTVWVYDDLSQGHRGAVPAELLIEGGLNEENRLAREMRERQIDSVMHFAAYALVGESVVDPAKYYANNVVGTLHLLEAMRAAEVSKIVFSSTCATYGLPPSSPITEEMPQQPINPYGDTKLAIEKALHAYAHAYGIGYAALRYFNASGASPPGDIGEDHEPESHLIPIILQVALGHRQHVTIFGDDYQTPDGTCIRDYIHVDDLGRAHILALEQLEVGGELKLNLGTGKGASVLEVLEACRRVTGHDIPAVVGDRRPGDPPELVADSRLAQRQLGWAAEYNDVEQIIETAWNWHRTHPHGYGDR